MNILASSIVHMQGWTGPQGNPSSQGLTQKVLVKLYDKDLDKFRLNEVVTFVGVLEFTEEQARA